MRATRCGRRKRQATAMAYAYEQHPDVGAAGLSIFGTPPFEDHKHGGVGIWSAPWLQDCWS
jgi:hypothetical protein